MNSITKTKTSIISKLTYFKELDDLFEDNFMLNSNILFLSENPEAFRLFELKLLENSLKHNEKNIFVSSDLPVSSFKHLAEKNAFSLVHEKELLTWFDLVSKEKLFKNQFYFDIEDLTTLSLGLNEILSKNMTSTNSNQRVFFDSFSSFFLKNNENTVLRFAHFELMKLKKFNSFAFFFVNPLIHSKRVTELMKYLTDTVIKVERIKKGFNISVLKSPFHEKNKPELILNEKAVLNI